MKMLAIALESAACCAVIAGICVEAIMHADVGYIIITSGALGVAVGGILYARVFLKEP